MRWDEHYASINTLPEFIGNLANHARLLEVIHSHRPKTVLEVGSGSGTLAVFLSQLGMEVTSIDNNPHVLEIAEKHSKKFGGNVVFLDMDAFDLDSRFPLNAFDLVFHQGFLEHFPPKRARKLLEIQLSVAPLVVFSIPNNHYKDASKGEILKPRSWWLKNVLSGFTVMRCEDYYTLPHAELKKRLFWLKPTMSLFEVRR